MSINLPNFQFASPPRCGTTWCLQAFYLAGLGEHFKTATHQPFPDDSSPQLRICTVRHPYTWLRSYYHAIYPGIIGIPCVDAVAPTLKDRSAFPDFPAFAEDYLAERAGTISQMSQAYNADSYLRIEDFPWNLLELLQADRFLLNSLSSGTKQAITSLPPANCYTKPWKGEEDGSLRRRIVEVEEELCEQFCYA